jgi:hypothetical protein
MDRRNAPPRKRPPLILSDDEAGPPRQRRCTSAPANEPEPFDSDEEAPIVNPFLLRVPMTSPWVRSSERMGAFANSSSRLAGAERDGRLSCSVLEQDGWEIEDGEGSAQGSMELSIFSSAGRSARKEKSPREHVTAATAGTADASESSHSAGATPVNITAIINRREKSLREKGFFEAREADPFRRGCHFRRNPMIVTDSEDSGDESSASSYEDGWDEEHVDLKEYAKEWRRTLRTIDPDLLTATPENQMDIGDRVMRKDVDDEPRFAKTAYKSIRLTEKNNADVQVIYNALHRPKAMRGQPLDAYTNFRTVIGQYARLCIALGLANTRFLYRPGHLFSLILHEQALQLFVYFFQEMGSPTSMNHKLYHLKVLAQFAELEFSAQPEKKALAGAAVKRLLGYARAEKREIRRNQGRTMDQRMAQGKHVVHSDYLRFMNIARTECASLERNLRQKYKENVQGMLSSSREWKEIVDKWCINILVYIMFAAHGQRTQVYRYMLVPSQEHIEGWKTQVSIPVLWEKTPRSLECPSVVVPERSRDILLFHMNTIRPFVIEKRNVAEDALGDRPFFIHTVRGSNLTTPEIRRTLRAFMMRYDPELKTITPMTLRYSYASIMFEKYKQGRAGKGLTIDQYLSRLATLMNTSVKMLKAHYVATDKSTFARTVKVLARAFEETEGDDSLEE